MATLAAETRKNVSPCRSSLDRRCSAVGWKVVKDKYITEAESRLYNIKQKTGEAELDYFTRYEHEYSWARSILSVQERISSYINGLEPRIHT